MKVRDRKARRRLAANKRTLVDNPFVSEAQRRACYAQNDPKWDCSEWSHATGKKKLPKKKAVHNKKRSKNPLRIDPTRTAGLRRRFIADVRRKFAILKGRIVKLIVDEDALGLRGPVVHNQGLEPPPKIPCETPRVLDWVSDIRQRDHFSCGAACAMAVGQPMQIGPKTLEEWKHALGTDVEESTKPQAIVGYFRFQGCRVVGQHGMTIQNLRDAIQSGMPVIVPVQDYGPEVPAKATFDYGHYLVVIGVIDAGDGYVLCQDPSEDNVVAGSDSGELSKTGSVQKPGRIVISQADFLKIWHDEDAEGNKYIRYGIAIGEPPTTNAKDALGHGSDARGGFGHTTAKITGNVLRIVKGPLVAKLSDEALKTVDQILFEQQVNSQHPGASIAAKVAVAAVTKAWFAGRKILTGNLVANAEPDEAETILELLKQLSEASGGHVEIPTLEEIKKRLTNPKPTANTRWKFHTDADKIKAFQAWLKQQMAATIVGQTEEALWKKYTIEGYKKGAGRAFDDVRTSRLRKEKPELFTPEHQDSVKDFYKGTRDEFLRSSFGQPETVEKVKLLAGRSFDDLKGVDDTMSLKMSRVLTDGLVEGKHPTAIARDLAAEVDIGRGRAELIARTEIIRAHAEGQLDAMESLGVEEVGVAAEWSTSNDNAVCEECEPLEGVILSIEEAHNMLPRHPGCRCSWYPANLGEKDEDAKGNERADTKREIQSRIRDSLDADGGKEKSTWAGADKTISKARPEPLIKNQELTEFSKFLTHLKEQ